MLSICGVMIVNLENFSAQYSLFYVIRKIKSGQLDEIWKNIYTYLLRINLWCELNKNSIECTNWFRYKLKILKPFILKLNFLMK